MAFARASLLTRGFIILCCVNFLFFLAFYMLIPVLPMYLLDDLDAGKSMTGVLLSLYVLAALFIRPVSAWAVDSFSRSGVFLCCAFLYAAVFCGYVWISALALFGMLRVLHGMAFGMVNTSVMTLAVDIIPPARIGSGMGIFGMATAIPMALGPMAGLMLYEQSGAMSVFYTALATAALGALLGLAAPASKKKPNLAAAGKSSTRFADKVLLPGSAKTAIAIAGVGFVYGIVLNFISVYAQERSIGVGAGFFFCILAAGTIASRLFAGRFIDGGKMSWVVYGGKAVYLAGIGLLTLLSSEVFFFAAAFLLGFGTGLLMPAYQTIMLSTASPSQRGLANSSFFIAWDGGIGVALFAGGFIAQLSSFNTLYMASGLVLLLAAAAYRSSCRALPVTQAKNGG